MNSLQLDAILTVVCVFCLAVAVFVFCIQNTNTELVRDILYKATIQFYNYCIRLQLLREISS